MSRWENAPITHELARMMGETIGIYCASYPTPPSRVTLDIDDTCDVVHGYQQLSFWNGHHGERCFMPIHIYDTATGRVQPAIPKKAALATAEFATMRVRLLKIAARVIETSLASGSPSLPPVP